MLLGGALWSMQSPGRRSIGHSYRVTVSMYLVAKPTDNENRSTALVGVVP